MRSARPQPQLDSAWATEPVGAVRLPNHERIENPRVLLIATLRWPLAARLAIALRKHGCAVDAWCPQGHPLEKTRAVARSYRGSALLPQRSLHAALHAAAPDFVIPCDDEAALHLQALHERASDRPSSAQQETVSLRRLLERSLGTPAACARATDRDQTMRLAAEIGVRVPPGARLAALADLDDWQAQGGFPAVLKTDRSWGGQGVAIVNDLEHARCTYRSMTQPHPWHALTQLLLRRDPSQVLRHFRAAPRAITVQRYVAGTPANRAVACWKGEVLAGISVLALQTQGATGPATVVQIIDNPEMTESAIRVVRALGLSGLCGLDFIIESSTGAAYMIEVNPRATPISHLALGADRDLPAALLARLRGEWQPASERAVPGDVIAMFPGEWRRDQASDYLRSAFHDVPWAEIDLVAECLEPPWEQRGLIARLKAHLLPRRAAAVAPPLPQ